MKLFAGLGNPGSKHARQRHNIGFMAVDAIHDAHGFPPWRSKFQAEIAEGRICSERVMLMKPQTYMNLSGQAVGEAMRYLKLGPDDVTVFHDELDLAPGKVRLKTGGGHAGHNGLRSLHQHIGEGYHRVRLGIGHPGRKELVSGYVLHDFSNTERDWLDPLIEGIGKAAGLLAAGDGSGFLNRLALERPAQPMAKAAKPDTKDDATPDERPETGEPGPSPTLTMLERLARHFSGRN